MFRKFWKTSLLSTLAKCFFVKFVELLPLGLKKDPGSTFFMMNLPNLTLSLRKFLSYGNQSVDLQSKSVDWFLYDRNLLFIGTSFIINCNNVFRWLNVYKTFNHEMSHYQKPIQVGWQARTYVEEILSRDL